MKILSAAVLSAALFAAAACGAFAEPELAEGVMLESGGEAIDVSTGHAVPVVVDWDEDGKKDLLVGQFSQGKIRFYRNTGSDEAPEFEGFEFLKAGGKDLSVPCG